MWGIAKREYKFYFTNLTGYLVIGSYLTINTLILWFFDTPYNFLNYEVANIDLFFETFSYVGSGFMLQDSECFMTDSSQVVEKFFRIRSNFLSTVCVFGSNTHRSHMRSKFQRSSSFNCGMIILDLRIRS